MEKKLEISLRFGADSRGASKALLEMEKETRRLDSATREAIKDQQRLAAGSGRGPSLGGHGGGSPFSTGPGMGSPSGKAPGPGGPSGPNIRAPGPNEGFAAASAKAFLLAAALAKAAEGAGRFNVAMHDTSRTGPDRVQRSIESIPIIGDISKSLRTGLQGLFFGAESNDLRQANERIGNSDAVRAANAPIDARMRAAEVERIKSDVTPFSARDMPDRGSLTREYGERYVEQFRDLEIGRSHSSMAERDAERQAAAFRDRAKDAGGDSRAYTAQADQLERQLKNSKLAVGNPDGERLTKELEHARKKATEALEREREAIVASRDAEMNLVGKRKESMAAENELIKAKRDRARGLLEERKGDIVGFASMTELEQIDLAATLGDAKKEGFGNLPVEQRRLLFGSGITADFAKEKAVEAYKSDPRLEALLKGVGKDNYNFLETEAKKFEASYDVSFTLSEEGMEKLVRAVSEKTGSMIAEMEVRLKRGVNAEQDAKMYKAKRAGDL